MSGGGKGLPLEVSLCFMSELWISTEFAGLLRA